ncbi:MAG: rhomboid family intramembrane serine protease [Bacteroidota bacterium]
MFTSIVDDIKNAFRDGNKLIQLIVINVVVFILLNIIKLGFMISGAGPEIISTQFHLYVGKYIEMPLNFLNFIHFPYTIITYQFVHYGLFHLFFNMLSLYWFGQILENVLGNSKTLALYLFGGLSGAFISIITFSILPNLDANTSLIGASAGIAAVIVAAATISPTAEVRLFIIGNVQIRYIALALILINLVSIPTFSNVGGSIAHLGGALFGYIFIKQLQNGNDFSKPLNRFLDWVNGLFTKKSKMKIVYSDTQTKKAPKREHSKQKELDIILDKISKSGYDSLSAAEKEFLFKYSNES